MRFLFSRSVTAAAVACALAMLSRGNVIAQNAVPFPQMLPWELGQPAIERSVENRVSAPTSALIRHETTRPYAAEVSTPEPAISLPAPPPELQIQETYEGPLSPSADQWAWQLLPDGLIYRSYLAGFKEPRFHSLWAHDDDEGLLWDIALGGRVGIVRYGSHDDTRPEGWQIDLEGAAFPRLAPEEERDLMAVDFRAGVPLTFGIGPHQTKFAYYHLSSHLGDEFLLKNPQVTRYNYSRDVLVLGQSYYVTPDLRLYGEAGWAFYSDVSGEWEFQFGIDYSPLVDNGFRGSPFAAFNGHLREEIDFSGNLVAQAGWQWRSVESGHLLRLGIEYFNGLSDQFEFFNQHENKVGLAIWYDY